MSESIRVPGINYPEPTNDLKVDAILKNVYDNLTYFKNLAETQQSTITSLEARVKALEDA